MSDQAQGLRALANQARRDPSGRSLLPAGVPSETPELSERTYGTTAESASFQTPVEAGVAVTDARLHSSSAQLAHKHARVLAVTSGKGGVGKTNFSTNLALTLAQQGQRVIVLDADLGLANLHIILGITPRYHLEHVLRGERTLSETLHTGPCGVQIIGGAPGLSELANLAADQRDRFIQSLQELDTLADVVIIDTGAGLSHNVLSFLHAAEDILVVTTPEPTAITDAYATIKVVSMENPESKLRLIVNMAQSEGEANAVAQRLEMIARQFLHIELEFLGYIPFDAAVKMAVRAQKPFVLAEPNSPASRSVARIAASLGFDTEQPKPTTGITGFLNRMQGRFAFGRK